MSRTSHTHPLRIDTIETVTGRLGLSICPGKIQPNAQTGSWNRDLDIDLAAIKNWGAGIVITLLEQDEMDALSVSTLGDSVTAHGMKWIHLPLPNDTVPDAAWIEEFQRTLPTLIYRFSRGENVFIHCMGGIGRTSVTAALILVHTGWSAEQSIAAVHRARAESFVMPDQADFVRRYERVWMHPTAPALRPN